MPIECLLLMQMMERLVHSAEHPEADDALSAATLGLLADLLCFCVMHHT